jgi:hypothetical protein
MGIKEERNGERRRNGEKELWKVQKGVVVGAEERAGFLSKVYCCPSTGWRGLRLIMRESSGA